MVIVVLIHQLQEGEFHEFVHNGMELKKKNAPSIMLFYQKIIIHNFFTLNFKQTTGLIANKS
jgi:hypothetical protein